jgi:NAD(P)-dependent dehydrogenase (short-subunit alcohol dehydrogenase family)
MDSWKLNGRPRFKDQVALVMGAAHGIGKAIAMRLGREGACVVIGDIEPEAMEHTVQEMESEGSLAKGVACDVRDPVQVEAAVRFAVEWQGRIDILMYIAGVATAVPFIDLDLATWDNTLDINLRGGFLAAKAVLPHMIARKSGKLVFMASTNSWDGEPQLAHYNASKSGLFLLSKTLAREYGKFGIRSNENRRRHFAQTG